MPAGAVERKNLWSERPGLVGRGTAAPLLLAYPMHFATLSPKG